MGATNSHAVFCAMMDLLKKEWNNEFRKECKRRGVPVPHVSAKVIVDDVLLSAANEQDLLLYFETVLKVLTKYRVTVNLKKCWFFTPTTEFVGVDVGPEGNSPAESKFPALTKLMAKPPCTATDLLLLIGFFGFYQE